MKARRGFKWVLIAAVPVVFLAAVTLWLLFQHIPTWYAPPVVRQEDYQRIRDNLLETEENFTRELLAAEPFTFTLSDTQVNEWVAARHAIWQPAAKWIPPEIENPVVLFRPGAFIVAGLLHHKDAKVIASAHLAADIDNDRLCVRLLGLQGGSLPLPTQWLIDTATDYYRKHEQNRNSSRPSPRSADQDEIIRQLAALPQGARFPNVVTWPNGKRDFLIESITFGQGTCTLRVRPYARGYPTR